MKFIFATCFFISLFQFAFSQTVSNSWYINLSGDTIHCVIIDKQWIKNPLNIAIVENGIERKILPIDIKEFKTASGDIYSSRILKVDYTPDDIDWLRYNQDRVVALDTVFLRLLVSGKYNLYMLYDEKGKNHFFYSIENSSPVELLYVPYLLTMSNGNVAKEYKVIYKNQIDSITGRKPDLYEVINSLNFKKNAMIEFFASLNAEQLKFKTDIEKSEYRIGILAEAGVNRMRHYMHTYGGIKTVSPLTFCYAAYLYGKIIPEREHRKFSLQIGFGFHSYGLNFDSLPKVNNTGFYPDENFYRLNYISADLGVNYNLSSGKIKMFAAGGYRFNYLPVIPEGFTLNKKGFTGENNVTSIDKRYEQLLYGGLGIKNGKLSYSILIGNSSGFSYSSFMLTRFDYLKLQLAYDF